MKIWVDADATPQDVKRVLFKGAIREEIRLTLVANVPLRHPESPLLFCQVVGDGFNVADDWIVEQVEEGDLVITADIPLAARVVEKGALALNPRGTIYSQDNIHGILATRNLLDDLRGASLVEGGGPPPYTKKDLQKFASAFNATVMKRSKS
ncbi:MAG: YaiI/YqxD family protein [Vulcanimicrobiota bacterium]